MEFDFKVSPFQKLQLNDATVTVEAQPASAPSGSQSLCGSPLMTLRRFRMFLPERDFKQETYFSGIQKMTTVREILENGIEVRKRILKKLLFFELFLNCFFYAIF